MEEDPKDDHQDQQETMQNQAEDGREPQARVSRMRRNPFTKQDCGCTFVCFLSIFAVLQVVFYYNYITVVYASDVDHVEKLIEYAGEKGFAYDSERNTFTPEPSAAEYFQRENFLDGDRTGNLLGPSIFFYVCSLFWLLSYF